MKFNHLLLALLFPFSLWAAAPQGYYTNAEGKSGQALLTALHQKIKDHSNVGYDGLWNVYKTSDVRPDGTVWDMYSTKHWNQGTKCGNYSKVGDCYNREHSVPQSWFDEAAPMKSDAFHVYPTDGKVNGQRSNYPFGECAHGTTLPSSGGVDALGRLGASTFAGYSGTVFEPADEYKGDFARTYFYMATCYNDRVSSWDGESFNHTAYPAFTSWTQALLLKWDAQDPVSDKERDRNEAVYAFQHNRNPYIDYPDLAQHVWGDKKTQAWHASGSTQGVIATPANGSAIDLGTVARGITRSFPVIVRGTGLSQPVTVTITGNGFSTSTTSLPAASVNSDNGATATIILSAPAIGPQAATLSLASGSVKSTVSLTATAVDGLPALAASQVTSESFRARWVDVDAPATQYSLTVMQGGANVSGFPVQVDAAAESYTVTGLIPSTSYIYFLTSPTAGKSNQVTVTTGAAIPMVQLYHNGDIMLYAHPGEPSDPAEIEVENENLAAPLSISVKEPFEISVSKSDWARSLTLDDQEDRFYLRLNGMTEGSYTTTIRAVAGSYVNDETVASGVISKTAGAFFESFEKPSELSGYDGGTYQGDAAAWNLKMALVDGHSNNVYSGQQGARLGTKENGLLEMADDKAGGAGVVTFWTRAWKPTETAQVSLEYSANHGSSWTPLLSFTPASTDWQQMSATLNHEGSIRLRFVKPEAGRVCLDDISISDYSSSAIAGISGRDSWDAYAAHGRLVMENNGHDTASFAVYSTDGVTQFAGSLSPGASRRLNLPAGLYIVASGDSARRVLVK